VKIRIQANPSVAEIERVEIVTEYEENGVRCGYMTAYKPTMPVEFCLKNHVEMFERRKNK
jgi:hypothetical protein